VKHATIIILFAAACLSSAAQEERSLKITTDRNQIVIGEQLHMQMVMTSRATDTVLFPQVGDTLVKEVEIVSRSPIDTAFSDDLSQRVLKQEFVLTSFDSGYFPIPPRAAVVNGDTLLSNPFLVAVQTVKVDTAQKIYDIRGVAEAPFSLVEWLRENWYWIAGALVFLALLTWFMLWWSKPKAPRAEPEVRVPAKAPDEQALERLDALAAQKLWQANKVKEYYSELTDILREYIEARFAFPALEQTSDEIILSMKHLPDFQPAQVDQVKRLLFLADLVKFAKEKPMGSENEHHFEVVKRFVLDTKEQTTPENGTPPPVSMPQTTDNA